MYETSNERRIREFQQKYSCPKCGSSNVDVGPADFVSSRCGTQLVQCRSCGHTYEREDNCTG